jgi:hypothetical protein
MLYMYIYIYSYMDTEYTTDLKQSVLKQLKR